MPRPAGVLLIVALVAGISSGLPLFRESSRQAALAAQIDAEAKTGEVTAVRKAQLEQTSHYLPYLSFFRAFIVLSADAMVTSAIYWALCNIAFGMSAPYRQVLVVVTHSQVIRGVGVLALLPFAFSKPLLAGNPFSLQALTSAGADGSRLARFLENVSIFDLWFCGVVAVGLAVLYQRTWTTVLLIPMGILLTLAYLGALNLR